MRTFLSIVQIILSIVLISVILMHQRKQSGFSGIFGGGTQADMGGQWQRFNTLTKITIVLAILFMLLSIVLVLISG
ncbi:MAG: preprotein translocase subunit SecG [Synergistaceae bacterium]|nr:preprotein translocase subunit SecG [Synergistaceae bacterium]